jgi:hypothetical protein
MNPMKGFAVTFALLLSSTTFVRGDAPAYVGAKKCRACHMRQYTTWAATKMAAAFDVLKPGAAAAAKTKMKVDPRKDYTHDANCLGCHTTGFGKPGGFRSIEETPDLAGVQCESCHGPHANVLKVMTIQNKSFKLAEARAAGLRMPDEGTCRAECHNAKSPMIGADYVFDYNTRKSQGTHEHLPLKYPHE